MKTAKLLLGGAAAAAVAAAAASAQFPALGSNGPATGTTGTGAADPSAALNGVVPPPPDPVGIAPQPFLPNGPTVWSRLGLDPVQREFYRRQAVNTPAGQLRAAVRDPISNLTGGVIPPFAPKTPSVAELKDPGPVGAAAKAKLDRAGAEQRIKAVKYLSTLDCHYWPEAEEALIGALRADRNECVRYEAANALLRGCCCTCKVTVALSIAVSCSEADGNPSERSGRVRAVAAHALDRCLSSACCGPELPPLLPPEPEKKVDPKTPVEGGAKEKSDDGKGAKAKPGDPGFPKQYYAAVAGTPRLKVAEMGRKALEIGAKIGYDFATPINDIDYAAAGLPAAVGVANPSPSTLLELFAWNDSGAAIAQPQLAPPAAAPRPAPAPAVRTALATTPSKLPTAVVTAPAKPAEPAKVPVESLKLPAEALKLPAESLKLPAATAAGLSEPKPAPPAPAVAVPAPQLKVVPPTPVAAPAPAPLPKPTPAPTPSIPVVAVPAAVPAPAAKPAAPTPPVVTAPVVTVPAVTVPLLPAPVVPVLAVPVAGTQPPAPVVPIAPVPTPVAPGVPPARPATPGKYFPPEPVPLGGDFMPRGR